MPRAAPPRGRLLAARARVCGRGRALPSKYGGAHGGGFKYGKYGLYLAFGQIR